jgi:DNA (cytosine-5)-methyltransferase 1
MISGGTLFSGIGAPEMAAPEIDWRWAAEIDPFASAVHAAGFPGMPNLGDVTEINADAIEPVDLIVFGSPCQDFSVAGKRKGMDGERGNLSLVALALVAQLRPRWLVFENVPGLLSNWSGEAPGDLADGDEREADQYSDFAAFLGTVRECGYLGGWRVYDAQFAGVAQRRRRVFFVGYLGDWRPAAAVLFEPESLRGDTAPRREAGQRVADHLTVGANQYSGFCGEPVEIAHSLNAHPSRIDGESETFITHALRADGFDASEDGTGRGTPLITFNNTGQGWWNSADVATGLRDMSAGSGSKEATLTVGPAMSVRRLTPRECERLQGFPDDFTAITYRGKPAADGPRYRALGNSMAVPVIGWVLHRIRQFQTIIQRAA